MSLWFTFLLCLVVQVLSAPQNGNGNILDIPKGIPDIPPSIEEVIKPTFLPPIEKKKVDPLIIIANIPSSPINVSDSAKPCASCGKGPLLACPKEDGECGAGEACCYDSCRARQVCRSKSEIVGFKEPERGRFRKRDTKTEGEEPISSRQNVDVPIPLDEEYGTFDVNSGVFSRPESFDRDQESLSVFASTGDGERGAVPPSGTNLYNKFQQDLFAQSVDFEEDLPFVFNHAPQPLIPVQQPVIIPSQYIPDNNEDEDDEDGGFFDSLFG